jgi:hypothetical protein
METEIPIYLSDPAFNPKQLTKAKLCSILSEFSIELPTGTQKKAVYLDLFEQEILSKQAVLIKQMNSIIPRYLYILIK